MGGEKEEVWSTGEEFKPPIVQEQREEEERGRERDGQTDRQLRTRTDLPPELGDMDVKAAMDKVRAHGQHLHCLVAAEPEVRGQRALLMDRELQEETVTFVSRI